MKKILFVLGFLMATSICVEGQNQYNNNVSISIQTFYDELAPYGEWIYTPDYGYAWHPYLDYNENFRPYATRGNWVYTDLGWTWVSDYRWGWATFHYGRWFFDDYFGWMWMPGDEWAPAWVTWGYYNDYWAWAPMGPNIYVNGNFTWYAPAFWWTFVPFRYFCANNWYDYTYRQPVQVTNITYITNIYYGNNNNVNKGSWYYGPRVGDVERRSNTRVQKRTLIDSDKPSNLTVRDNNLTVYRPGVTQKRENPQPTNFRTVDQTKINSRTVDQGKVNSRTVDPGKINSQTDENSRVNIRTQPVKQQTTETTMKRYGEPNTQPPTSTQETREKNNIGIPNKQVEKSTTQGKATTSPKTSVKPAARETTPTKTTPPKTRSK